MPRTGRRALTASATSYKSKLAWQAQAHLSCRLAQLDFGTLLRQTAAKAVGELLRESKVGGHTSGKLDHTDRLSLLHWAWEELSKAKKGVAEKV
jgi:hypothetical protein